MRVKFWGTRGLIASPRADTAIFGGSTPCVQILHNDQLIIVDTGFGCTNLGDELMTKILAGQKRMEIHIFFTHFHWDHIQGLPFFKPIYFPTTTLHLYSPAPTAVMLENLNILFDGIYSPFESLLSMQASIQLWRLDGKLNIGDLEVDCRRVDHGTSMNAAGEEVYAYKFTSNSRGSGKESICLITDHEARKTKVNDDLVKWAKGCDILIHDGQYSAAEYKERHGWGHSSAEAALQNALAMQAGLTLLTHHDPGRSDRELQQMHRQLLKKPKLKSLNFEFAREDVVYEVKQVKLLPKVG